MNHYEENLKKFKPLTPFATVNLTARMDYK